jgi:hypothetical protein
MVPFLAALALLTVIGASTGWIVGTQVVDRRAAAARDRGYSAPPAEPTREPDTASAGPPCPEAAEKAAADAGSPGGLVEVFYARTEDDRQIWICRDSAGALFYQGYIGPVGGELRQGDNALFLTGVQETDGGYTATNTTPEGTTTYQVTPTTLIHNTNGDISTFPVVEHRPG